MIRRRAAARPADAAGSLLPGGRLTGPMPWVLAIMMMLMVLAAALGLALLEGQLQLERSLAREITVQLLASDQDIRATEAARAAARLAELDRVVAVRSISDAEVERLLAPWLGAEAAGTGLPLPALIDATLDRPADTRTLAALTAEVRAVAPSARLDAQAAWLGPISAVARSLVALAGGLVLLLAAATCAVVVLAVRASLNANRGTIEIMHHLGATDHQIARLFQKRLAMDALFGGLVGLGAALAVLILLGGQISAVGSELLRGAALPLWGWAALAILPLLGVALATGVARVTVLRTLRAMP